MEIKKISNNIIMLDFDTQKELASTFLRFQEHYESPKFRGEIFTLGQYRDWYSQEYGAYTYCDDWNGFNIPSSVLEPFKKGLFDPLTKEEVEFMDLFGHRTDKFYIIGIHSGGKDTKKHEIAHALYFLNEEYKKSIDEILYRLKEGHENIYNDLCNYLKKLGYHESVINDECQAYIIANSEYLEKKAMIIVPWKIQSALQVRFNSYCEGEDIKL